MITLIPVPKKCNLKDERRHAIPLAVYTAVGEWGAHPYLRKNRESVEG